MLETTPSGRKYWYTNKRQGRKVRRIYLACGAAAEQAAAEAQARKQQRQQEQAVQRQEQAACDGARALIDAVIETTDLLTRAHLMVAGFHRHHRWAWRKRRG
jgi:hypothetical protein